MMRRLASHRMFQRRCGSAVKNGFFTKEQFHYDADVLICSGGEKLEPKYKSKIRDNDAIGFVNTKAYRACGWRARWTNVAFRTVTLRKCGHKSATVITHHFGVNLAVPYMTDAMAGGLVPDLDVFAKISFDINKADGILGIDTTEFGDQFPNCEAFIEDGRETRVFWGHRVGSAIP